MKLKPVVAGSFYPGKVSTLQKMLDDFCREEDTLTLSGEPVGLLLPHAGYVYSGSVAAKGYRALAPFKPSLVVVAGPSHYMAFKGCSLFSGEAVLTPQGEVGVDTEACRILKEEDKNLAPGFSAWREGSAGNHGARERRMRGTSFKGPETVGKRETFCADRFIRLVPLPRL
jgi:AmmeMemoRadiSam system protein B